MNPTEKEENNILRYASLGTQLLVAIALTLWFGNWLDKKMSLTTPVFAWLLPLVAIVGMMIKLIKETSQKK